MQKNSQNRESTHWAIGLWHVRPASCWRSACSRPVADRRGQAGAATSVVVSTNKTAKQGNRP